MLRLVETTTNTGEAAPPPSLPFSRAEIEQTVPARFEQVVCRFPNHIALTGAGRQWTYQDLNRQVNRIAHAIKERTHPGVGCVPYLLDHSPEMVIATLAVLKAGKTYLAIHPRMPAKRQAEIVRDVAPDLILTTAAFESRARELMAGPTSLLMLDEIDAGFPEDSPQIEIRPHDPSTIFYTSGTTGQPKGVVKSHRAVLHRVWLFAQHDAITPADRQSLLTHCSFSASEADMFGALLNGATLCVFDFASEGLTAFREWLEEEQITLLHPPVLLFRRFLSTLEGENLFPSVRSVALAGDVVLRTDIEKWKLHFGSSCVLMHRFSTTETGLLCVARIDANMVKDLGALSAGRPVADKCLELVDESGQPVARGEIGELVVKSRYIAEGYWHRPEETAPVFKPDPEVPGQRIYRTGDRGRFLSDGSFEFLGRADHQVKIRGFRVELNEIEAVLRQHPIVREAVVVVLDNVPNDKQLIAYIVPSQELAPTGGELRAFLQQKLPDYMIPSAFVFLEALPLTPNGKIDRRALPPPDRSRDRTSTFTQPQNEVERQLVKIWEEILMVNPVGTRENFFDLGGHSLLAAVMFARLEECLRIRLPLATLFRAPTIEGLAAVIGKGSESQSWRSLVSIQPAGSRPPLFAVPGVGGNVLGFNDLARLLGPEQPFYGLQSRGLSGTEKPLTSIEEIAATYLEEIRELQPEGPYYLAGGCMGAVVAYEMAQQLHSAGQKVGLLALLEPRPPVVTSKLWFRPALRVLAALNLTVSRIRLYGDTLARLRGRQRFEYLIERLKTLKQMVAQRDLFRGDRNVFYGGVVRQANLAAVHHYKPHTYPGRVVLFQAEGRNVAPEEDRRLHWSRLAAGGLEIYNVPGDDSGLILVKPNVQVLAQQLKACLERAQIQAPAKVFPHVVPRESQRLHKAEPQSLLIDNVSDGYIELLNAYAVDYIFINPGSDIAPIQESIAKFKAQGRRAPELILCLHESVAMAAAHGYFMITGRPQVVLVHVDVGTQNIGANLHNAQRGRAGVVICAGRSPYTVDGNVEGGRNRSIDWIQEQFNQAGIVQNYVKWHYELTRRENLHVAMQRAFQLAGTEPAGPVYLTLPKEVLLEKLETPIVGPRRTPVISTLAADPESLAQAAQWLIEAERPLILVAYAGRNPKAVASLVRLAEKLAAPVVELRHRMNFPTGHPLHLGFSAAHYLQHADCVLIVDHDVPWVPAQGQPPSQCRIIHVDIDPLKRDIPIWGFPVDLSIQADSSQAMAALAEEVERRLSPTDRPRIETRRHVLTAEHEVQKAGWRQRALDLAVRQPIAPEWAAYCLNEIVDDDTVIVSEAVSNNPVLWHYLNSDKPGTYYQSLGSGLGWGLGAALGAKLASPSKTIICTVGDGSWVFGSPIVTYWAAEQHRSPFLTVIFNNQAYAATTEAILAIAPEGYARKTGNYPACDLPKPPLYSKVAEAMGLWARTVDDPAKLQSVLREALQEVHRGRSALVDICVSLPRPLERKSKE